MFSDALKSAVYGIRSAIGTNGLAARLAEMEGLLGRVAGASASPPGLPLPAASSAIDVNVLLHQSRGAMLRGMPKGAARMLSAGCAGRWYFDWIEQTYGRVAEHVGIEFYTPRPDDLPGNVTWMENTASDMSAVRDDSVDLVFSGQNLEHLWPEEVSGFMLEAARVLRPGGHLVVDSPNRLVTAPLNWSHPEHTIELTPEEAGSLFRLSGFDVEKMKGIWLCRDARQDRVLSFDPNVADPDWSVTERLIAAHDNPGDAFIWWIEGVRSSRTPDRDGVRALMSDLFARHWPERTQRLIVPANRALETRPDGAWVVVEREAPGIVVFGPYLPLRAGRYRCTWNLLPDPGAAAQSCAVFDILAQGHEQPLARHEADPRQRSVSLEIELASTTFGLQFRCASLGEAGFRVRRDILLEQCG